MRWRTLVASVAVSLAAAGCQPDQTFGQSAGTPGLALSPGPGGDTLARSQKPDGEAPKGPPASTDAPRSAGDPPKTAIPAEMLNVKSLLDVAPPRDEKGEVETKIRATVNGQPVFDSEVRSLALPMFNGIARERGLSEAERNRLNKKVLDETLQELVNRELILQDAFKKFGKQPKTIEKLKESATKEYERKIRDMKKAYELTSDEQVKRFLKVQGTSPEALRRKIEREFLMHTYIQFVVGDALESVIGPAEITAYYKGHPEEFQGEDRVEWQDLFLFHDKYGSPQATRAAAAQIRDRIRAGEKFDDFIQYDDGESHLNHGVGTGHRHGEIRPPEAEAQLFQMHDGDVGELVEISTGIHIIRLIHRETAGLKPCDEKVQLQIRDKLRSELANRELQRYLQDLKHKAQIEISQSL